MTIGLSGLRLWVTRPRDQAAGLIAAIKSLGADVAALPLLEIAPPANFTPLDTALAQLEQFDLAIFVSPSAINAVCDRLSRSWPQSVPVAVMGPGSVQRAEECGMQNIISPDRQFDSAGLLQMPQLQAISGKKIVLFRGDGGREDLPQTLRERGADLTLIQAYRRLPPAFDEAHLRAELNAGCDGIVITSSEAVHYLFRLAGEQTRLQLQSHLYFAPHARIVAALTEEGAHHAVLTAVGDTGITATITQYFSPELVRALTTKKTHDAG